MADLRIKGDVSGYVDLVAPDVAGSTTIDLSKLLVSDSSGNVGIGTTSPGYPLHVTGTGSSHQIRVERTGTGNTNIGVDATGSFIESQTNLPLRFFEHGGETMRMDDGKVGIGTTSPGSQDGSANNLVVEDTASNGGITIKTPTTAIGGIHFSDGTSGADRYRGIISYSHSENSMRFHTNTARAMTIDSSGRVGIGTENPSDALHIASGGIVLPGAITTDAQINFYNSGATDINLQTFPLANQTLRLKGRTDKIFYHSDRGTPDFGEVFGIDTYGRVTMPYQPAFSAVNGNHAVSGDLVFGNTSINRGNHYNTSNGRFTAPVAGAYAFMFYGMAENGNTNLRARIYINGASHPSGEHIGGVAYQASGTYQQMVLNTILDLNAGDYVNMHWQSSYGSMHEWHNKFSGWLIG